MALFASYTLEHMLITITALLALSSPSTICIDPGHPSEVGRGTAGLKITEVALSWQIANLLSADLKKRGYRVVLTKVGQEQMVRNRDRAAIANNSHADLMVRLHCDADSGSGFAVYYPAKQGTSQGVTGPSARVIEASAKASKRFHLAMAAKLKGDLKDNGLKSDEKTAVGGRQGALTGSIFSKVPVLLVEMVVLTNRSDESFILSRAGKAAMVDALAAGVEAAVPVRR